MITSEDKIYIMDLVADLTPDILKKIHFDPTTKEVGHAYHAPFEAELSKALIKHDPNFTKPKEDRNMADVFYKREFINIKFGHKKKGHPNIASGNKLFDYLFGCGGKSKREKIDSYYILSVDADGPEYKFINIYDYIDGYTSYNAGPGQYMLNELRLKADYVFNQVFPEINEEEMLNKILDAMYIALLRTTITRWEKILHKDNQLIKKFGERKSEYNIRTAHQLKEAREELKLALQSCNETYDKK